MLDAEHLFNGYRFADLLKPDTLRDLDTQFLQQLSEYDACLTPQLLAYRANPNSLTAEQTSTLLLACSPILDDFLTELFSIETAVNQLKTTQNDLAPLFSFKKWFVQRRARRRLKRTDGLASFTELSHWLNQQLQQHEHIAIIKDKELAIATLGELYLTDKTAYADEIEQLTAWCVRALTSPEGQQTVKNWVCFTLPQPKDHFHLIPLHKIDAQRSAASNPDKKQRQGFKLTDTRMSHAQVLGEINYCVYCHEHGGDFCSKGTPVAKKQTEKNFKSDPLGNILTGCPLEEKISEMQVLKKDNHALSALAMIMVDNPMCPATGHRICNECMKSCIYQKQDPVNIPEIETRVLTDVLDLPWGVEIYDLLTRWNPLRVQQYLPNDYNGINVLIAGQGPAGFTLAHHLLMEGCGVVGIEGLKIEPLDQHLLTQPIKHYQDLQESLDDRVMAGFGGVAEYGITVRWDKNFLKLIYLSLMRRPYYQLFGQVRFGGTVTVEDAWELGFDHVAIAVGAGLPQALPIENSLAIGMRQANDFLMALQLTGAARASSLANLQIRLPALVVGGGLTGIDTATELQAYYLVQIEKIQQRYHILTTAYGTAHVREQLDPASLTILDEYLNHAELLYAERDRATAEGKETNIQKLLHEWGGVTVVYRRSLQESPAYISNHEEVAHAFTEGIFYAEGLQPTAALLDEHGHVDALRCIKRQRDEAGQWHDTEEHCVLPARALLVATGAKPNIAYEFEHRGHFERDGFQYRPYVYQAEKLTETKVGAHCKDPDFGAFTSYEKDDKRVTFIGDTHPVFNGNVVRAVASGMQTYPQIMHSVAHKIGQQNQADYQKFSQHLQQLFNCHVVRVTRHAPKLIELVVHAPLAAQKFQAGQFFRVQNYETDAPVVAGTRLQTEAMALLASSVDKTAGTISLMVVEQGASSRLCASFKPQQPLALMGPTGARAAIPKGDETILIIGGQLGAIEVCSLGAALKAAGNRVLYIGYFRSAEEISLHAQLEAATDSIYWITATGDPITPNRNSDHSITADFEAGLMAYATADNSINLTEVTRIMMVDNPKMVRRFQDLRCQQLRPHLTTNNVTASVHGSMQCMLKGVCAQCLQWQIDPKTGQRTKAVFACSWQDQPIDIIDIENISERQQQNQLQEHLSSLWVDHLFHTHGDTLPRQ